MILDEKFWLAVCFVIFVAIAYRPIKKAIFGMIDRRIELIKDDLNKVKAGRLETEANLKKSQAQLKHIISEREGLLKIAKDDISEILKESEQELEISLKRKERDAESRLEQLKQNATKDLNKIFTSTAKELTELYLKEHKTKLPKDEVVANHLLKR